MGKNWLGGWFGWPLPKFMQDDATNTSPPPTVFSFFSYLNLFYLTLPRPCIGGSLVHWAALLLEVILFDYFLVISNGPYMQTSGRDFLGCIHVPNCAHVQCVGSGELETSDPCLSSHVSSIIFLRVSF